MSLRQPTSTLDSPLAAWLSSLTVGDSEREPSAGRRRDSPRDAPGEGAGAGPVQRCVVVQKDQLGFGFTVCGERVKLVQNVRAGGAAVKAGVREGDRIVKVNGSLVSSMSHQEVVKLIKSGTYVALTLQGPAPSPPSSPADPAPAQGPLPGGETGPAPPSPSGPSGGPSQRITGPKPLRDSEVQKHASQILRKMLRQEETELQALMEERGRNPSPSLEERIESAKRRAQQVRLKLLPDAGGTWSESLAGAVTGVEGHSAADWSEGDAEVGRPPSRPAPRRPSRAFGSPRLSPSLSFRSLPDRRQSPDARPPSDWSGRADIIGPEDEDADASALDETDGPFQDVELLKSRPAHMSVFLRYVFTQLLDPKPLLFYLSAEAYLSAAPKDARSLAPQICSHFLHPDAPLKLQVADDDLADIESRFHAQEDIRRPLSELQRRVLPHVREQLVDYRNKRTMGLGALFGEGDLLLLDGDPAKERQVVEKQLTALWEILCEHQEDKSSPLASAVLLYLRRAGVKPRDCKAFPGLSADKEKWPTFLKAKKPSGAKKDKEAEDKKRNPILKYIGKPRSASQSTFHVPSSPAGVRPGSVRNIIERFESHSENGGDPRTASSEDGGDPRTASSEDGAHSPGASLRLARSESLKARGEGRRRGAALCGRSVPRSRSDVDVEDPAEERERPGFGSRRGAARSPEEPTPPRTSPRSIRRGAESPPTPPPDADGPEEEAREAPRWQETVPPQLWAALGPGEAERQAVIYELFTTEASHLRTLRVLDQVFFRKMRAVLSADELACVFPNLPQVYELHAGLCEAMRKRRESGIVQDIGDVMLARFDGAAGEEFERQASRLCRQQTRALELIKSKQRKEPRFAHVVQECEASRRCRRLQLPDLLVSEMQRLTKYPLLLDSIIKRTEASSSDLPALRRAQACCRGILRAVNEAVREMEHRHHLSKYQRRLDVAPRFKGLDLSTKKMIHEGPLVWKVSKDKRSDVQALLLSDCLLLLRRGPDERPSPRQPSRWPGAGGDGPLLHLDSLLVRPVATDNKALYVISTKEMQIYELVAGTAAEKNTWKDFLENTIAASVAGTPPADRDSAAAASPGLGGACPLEAADTARAENGAGTQDRAALAFAAARDPAGVAQAALRDVETLRRLLLAVAREDVWSRALRDSPDESPRHPREAAPPEGNVFRLVTPGESATDPTDEVTDHGRERDPSERREEEAPWHVVNNVEGVFRTIEDLTSKLRQLKDMEGEHGKLLTSLREPSAPGEEEDRGRADGKEASPAQPRIQTTGL